MSISVRAGHGWRRRLAGVLILPVALALIASACVMNGSWAATAPPVVPVQALPTAFADVSCVTDDWCMGVGSFGDLPLVETWDGTTWSVATAPPIQAATGIAAMVSVDCGTPTSCIARINRYPEGPEDFMYLVAWDGAQWRDVPPGQTIDGPFDDPAPYSCAPDGGCLIADEMDELTVAWNGSTFTTTPYSTSPPGLSDVEGIECFAGNDCIALTTSDLQHWNGTAWSKVAASDFFTLPVIVQPIFACGSSANCVAFALNGPGTSSFGLHWDGATWTSKPLPSTNHWLLGDLSCAGGECVGITINGVAPGATTALVTFVGGNWYPGPTPPTGTQRLSCLPLHCLAVGSTGTPAQPVAATYTWTNP